MYVLAIDPGLMNLGICIMSMDESKEYTIHLWDNIDLTNETEKKCEELLKDKITVCNKKASLTINDKFLCKKHFPKDTPITKVNTYKPKNFKDYILQDIALIVITKIEELFNNNVSLMMNITNITIELQPRINHKMKFISHVIYTKLIDLFRERDILIRFEGAGRKLKVYTGPKIECNLKNPYKKRKFLSIEYIKYFLENKFTTEQRDKWLPLFLSHKKTDDISDSALICISTLKRFKNIKHKQEQ